jgi:signal transduction histidine kinase
MLEEFIAIHREEIIGRCRVKVATRLVRQPATAEIEHGVPVFLDQLVSALRHPDESSQEIGRTALLHGHDLLLGGFTVSEVVHDYGDVCQSVTELAVEKSAYIPTDDFRTLNRCLDDAIAGAVTEYGREQNQSSLEEGTARGSERLGFLAYELRNLSHTALLAFEVLKTGNVGVAGTTGNLLHRSLTGLGNLIHRSVTEVRLSQAVKHRERFLVAEFIKELAASATLEARARGVKLTVMPVEDGVAVEADRQILAETVGHVLQNAFKFTRPGTMVTLRVSATPEHVLIEVQDECNGLPSGDGDDLFRPLEQRGVDRTGLGLGLAFCRWAVEANHGTIDARSVPDKGCVFTVTLPRVVSHRSAQPVTPLVRSN